MSSLTRPPPQTTGYSRLPSDLLGANSAHRASAMRAPHWPGKSSSPSSLPASCSSVSRLPHPERREPSCRAPSSRSAPMAQMLEARHPLFPFNSICFPSTTNPPTTPQIHSWLLSPALWPPKFSRRAWHRSTASAAWIHIEGSTARPGSPAQHGSMASVVRHGA